ncbi:hypothetical protein ACVWYH_010495 [Bradyrhizobium sp. GM24.11]
MRLAKLAGVNLRQSYARVGKFALIQHQRYAHAKQFKRANRALKTLRTYLGRVIRDIGRKIDGNGGLKAAFAKLLPLARRVREQQQRQRGPKVYSLHAPEVECIGKGKAHRPYEFGVKVSVATTISRAKGGQSVTHVKALPGNPYDGHTLATVIPDMEAMVGNTIARILADKGYRGHNAPPDHKFRVFISGQKRSVNCAAGPPSNPSSAISRPSTAWAAIISGAARGTPPTPSLPPPATTSAASSAGSACCCAESSWLSPPRFRLFQRESKVLHGRPSNLGRRQQLQRCRALILSFASRTMRPSARRRINENVERLDPSAFEMGYVGTRHGYGAVGWARPPEEPSDAVVAHSTPGRGEDEVGRQAGVEVVNSIGDRLSSGRDGLRVVKDCVLGVQLPECGATAVRVMLVENANEIDLHQRIEIDRISGAGILF